MVNHGLSTGALFLLVGMIYERRHTREISELKGLQKSAPIMAAVFTLVMFSSIGLPGLNGFVGEFLILARHVHCRIVGGRWSPRSASSSPRSTCCGPTSGSSTARPTTPTARCPTSSSARRCVLAPLLGLIVFLGVYPKPVLDRIEPSVVALIDHVSHNVPDFSENGPKTDEQLEQRRPNETDRPTESAAS